MIAATILLLAAWSLIFRDVNRTRMLTSSLWLFALPMILLVASNYALGIIASIPAVLFILFEEILKLAGSRFVAKNRLEAVCLVSLFGVWEIIITKLISAAVQNYQFNELLERNYLSFSFITLGAFVMHLTTAFIYAVFREKLWITVLFISFIVHAVFNFSRDFYIDVVNNKPEINLSFVYFDVVFFCVICFLLLLAYRSQERRLR